MSKKQSVHCSPAYSTDRTLCADDRLQHDAQITSDPRQVTCARCIARLRRAPQIYARLLCAARELVEGDR